MSATYEAEQLSAYPSWVGYAPNDELKLTIILALHKAGEPLGGTPLQQAVNDLQGHAIAFSDKLPRQFGETSLNQAGFTEAVEIECLKFGRTPLSARGTHLTQYGAHLGVAVAANFNNWSSSNSALSLRGTLGATSHDRSTGTVSHTAKRLEIFRKLLSNNSLAVTDFSDNPDESSTPAILAELASEELVISEGSNEQNRRTFEIIDPIYRLGQRKRAFDRLNPEIQAMFKVFRVAYVQSPTWEFDAFIKLAADQGTDEATLRKMRVRLQTVLAPSTQQFGANIRNISGPLYANGDKYTAIKLNPVYRSAISELLSLVDAHVLEDEETIAEGHRIAHQMNGDPDWIAGLIAKSRQASAQASPDPNLINNLQSIVSGSDKPLDRKDVHQIYQNTFNRKVALQSVSIGLWKLMQQGSVVRHKRPEKEGKTRSTPLYLAVN